MQPNRSKTRIRATLCRLAALPLAIWMGLALSLRLPGPGFLTASLGILAGAGALAVLFRWPGRRGVLAFALSFAAVLAGFLALRPSNHRDWCPDVAQCPTCTVDGDCLTFHQVRNCSYTSEFNYSVRFEDRSYRMEQVQGIDLFLISWGPRHIAHTIISFDFGQAGHLAFSIETRKERGETYSALRGFFRQYELCVIASEEQDLIGLRSNLRNEEVRLYHLNTPPAMARLVLQDYLQRINTLAAHPEWYNALTDNCTTALAGPVRSHSRRLPWSWKLVASGHLDELLYQRGIIDRSQPLETLRQSARINALAQAGPLDATFSQRIRAGQPGQ